MYHSTSSENILAILKEGLKPNKLGIVYLSPDIEHADKRKGKVLLEVETGDLKLTAFEDCVEWEVLCWGTILPTQIRLIKGSKTKGG